MSHGIDAVTAQQQEQENETPGVPAARPKFRTPPKPQPNSSDERQKRFDNLDLGSREAEVNREDQEALHAAGQARKLKGEERFAAHRVQIVLAAMHWVWGKLISDPASGGWFQASYADIGNAVIRYRKERRGESRPKAWHRNTVRLSVRNALRGSYLEDREVRGGVTWWRICIPNVKDPSPDGQQTVLQESPDPCADRLPEIRCAPPVEGAQRLSGGRTIVVRPPDNDCAPLISTQPGNLQGVASKSASASYARTPFIPLEGTYKDTIHTIAPLERVVGKTQTGDSARYPVPLDETVLRDPIKLRNWFAFAIVKGWVQRGEIRHVFAVAHSVLRRKVPAGRVADPVAAFHQIVRRKHWKNASHLDDVWAGTALSELSDTLPTLEEVILRMSRKHGSPDARRDATAKMLALHRERKQPAQPAAESDDDRRETVCGPIFEAMADAEIAAICRGDPGARAMWNQSENLPPDERRQHVRRQVLRLIANKKTAPEAQP